MIEEMIEGLEQLKVYVPDVVVKAKPLNAIWGKEFIDTLISYLQKVKDVVGLEKKPESTEKDIEEYAAQSNYIEGYNQAVDLCNKKIAGVVAENGFCKEANKYLNIDNAKLHKEVEEWKTKAEMLDQFIEEFNKQLSERCNITPKYEP